MANACMPGEEIFTSVLIRAMLENDLIGAGGDWKESVLALRQERGESHVKRTSFGSYERN